MMTPRFDIIPAFRRWLVITCILAGVGAVLFFSNLRFSIEFTGGLQLTLDTPEVTAEVEDRIENSLREQGFTANDVEVGERDGYPTILMQAALESAEEIDGITSAIVEVLIAEGVIGSKDDILEQAVIGPSVGDYVRRSATNALLLGLLFMAIYILFAFASMRHFISPAMLGLITIVTMLFDVLVPAGAYGVLMAFNPAAQVDMIFVIALLTIMGYSINDTIIILDRVRENFGLYKGKIEKGQMSRKDVYEMSVWQTMRRSIGTSLSTFFVVVVMFIFGTGVLKLFAFVLGFGILAGSFSSIFIAAPLAYVLSGKEKGTSKEKADKK